MLICMLAAYLVWHLRRVWAPLCFTDNAPPARADPVGAASRSSDAQRKAPRKVPRRRTADGEMAHSLATLLGHLATLTRNRVVFDGGVSVDKLATPTPTQRRAFELIGASIPLALK